MSIYFKHYTESKIPPNSDGFGNFITLEKVLGTCREEKFNKIYGIMVLLLKDLMQALPKFF